MFEKIKKFVKEVKVELTKVTWPTPSEPQSHDHRGHHYDFHNDGVHRDRGFRARSGHRGVVEVTK